MPGINNILHHQNMLVQDISFNILAKNHMLRAFGIHAIARQAHKIQFQVGIFQGPRKIAEKNERSLQYANGHKRLISVNRIDFGGKRPYTLCYAIFVI